MDIGRTTTPLVGSPEGVMHDTVTAGNAIILLIKLNLT